MTEFHDQTITQPTTPSGDGICACDGDYWRIWNCVVDFSEVAHDKQDELLSADY